MKLVKQFKLEVEPSQQIEMPFDAEIVHFGVSGESPCIWAEVDSTQKIIMRTFIIVADNAELPKHLNATKYIGSFWHEVSKEKMLHVYKD